jgi:hypothetical protein
MGWSDVEVASEFEDIQYTHWNHDSSKGSRIDRIYADSALRDLVTSPTYIRFAFGDHLMRKVTIGDPDFGPSYVPEGKLFDSDFELAEVKTAVAEVWANTKQQWSLLFLMII